MLNGIEAKIEALRRLADRLNLMDQSALISYRIHAADRLREDCGACRSLKPGKYHWVDEHCFSFASVAAQDNISNKRSWEGTEVKHLQYKRWSDVASSDDNRRCSSRDIVLPTAELRLCISEEALFQRADDPKPLTAKLGNPNECALFTTEPARGFSVIPDDLSWALHTGSINLSKLFSIIAWGQAHIRKHEGTGAPTLIATNDPPLFQISKATRPTFM